MNKRAHLHQFGHQVWVGDIVRGAHEDHKELHQSTGYRVLEHLGGMSAKNTREVRIYQTKIFSQVYERSVNLRFSLDLFH